MRNIKIKPSISNASYKAGLPELLINLGDYAMVVYRNS